MPPEATVQTATASRACPDCHQPIGPDRRYCDRDRDRRRALTFLRQAWVILKHTERSPAVVCARDHVLDAIEELTR